MAASGEGSSSDIQGQLHSPSSADAGTVAALDSAAAVAAATRAPASSSSASSSAVIASSPSSYPPLSHQQHRTSAHLNSSDSDGTPVSPVRNSNARSTPIAIGAGRCSPHRIQHHPHLPLTTPQVTCTFLSRRRCSRRRCRDYRGQSLLRRGHITRSFHRRQHQTSRPCT